LHTDILLLKVIKKFGLELMTSSKVTLLAKKTFLTKNDSFFHWCHSQLKFYTYTKFAFWYYS